MSRFDRPWGFYEVIETRSSFQVKHLVVHPGMRLSLQSHELRSEHWYILSGTGVVTIDSNSIEVHPGDSVTIPFRAKHRVSADMGCSLEFIEIQTGLSFDEADIVRYEDDFGRAGS
jgi:mannose-6-phosphate isomerase-like protein (cupin superfamily)